MTDAYTSLVNHPAEFSKNITIDLAARYAAAFGAMAIGRAIDRAFIEKKAENEYGFETFPRQAADIEYVKMTIPNLEPLEFSSVLHGETGSIFAPPLMMTFSQEKSLIETEVNDDDPIVIERWGTKPWDISINGLLIDLDNRIYPSDEIRRLNQNWKYNGVVEVVGRQFEELDIDAIYFRTIEFVKLEGFQDTVQFSINASSIKSVNFTLMKPKGTIEDSAIEVIGIQD